MTNDNTNRILFIDKPKGITSFDVIRRLRKEIQIKKIGHAGTLDPAATGLMIIGIGDGTKQLKNYQDQDKIYIAEVLLGTKTDSGDLDGEILEEEIVHKLPLQTEKVLNNLLGSNILEVSKYSAMKQHGQPLYKLVRQKKKYIIPKREMVIYWINLNKHYPDNDKYILEMELKVSTGTYIRSIAEEIGRQLNVPATLKNLRRIQIGEINISQAIKLKKSFILA
ncbi:MAG: tRNA pseudouridine(55) synthase TruB [Patescibacteria group bacterium]